MTGMYRAKRDGRNCVRVWEDYPEWRRSQVRDAPTGVEPESPPEVRAQAVPTPDWKILADGLENDKGDEGSADDSDEWDDI